MRRRAQNAGFTLIELLVSMTLLALLTVALYQSLSLGLHAWARVQSVNADDVRLVQSFLRSKLTVTFPLLVTKDVTEPYVDFDGEAQSVSFLAPAPLATGGGGNARFVVRYVTRGDNGGLEMSSRPELAPEDASFSKDVLITRLSAADFAYYGSVAPDDAPAWHRQWKDMKSLPTLVRIRAKFIDGDARAWPDLVIAPRIFGDVCRDQQTKSCQGR